MNHSRIAIDFYDRGQVSTIVYQDSPDREITIVRDPDMVAVYTTIKTDHGYARQKTCVIYPWHRIHEIRYYGER